VKLTANNGNHWPGSASRLWPTSDSATVEAPGAASVPLRVWQKSAGRMGDRLEGVAALVAAGDA